MTKTNAADFSEVLEFIEDMYHADVIHGLFMVFDGLLNGFTIAENHKYLRDENFKETGISVSSKVAMFSQGMFHLVKFQGNDEIWFIVGEIHTNLLEYGYDLEMLTEIAIDTYDYSESVEEFIEADGDELSNFLGCSASILVANWNEFIIPCLDKPEILRGVLIKICRTLQLHSEFLLAYGDENGFNGLAADLLENDEYSDKNLELLFKAFIKRVNQDIIPKLDFK